MRDAVRRFRALPPAGQAGVAAITVWNGWLIVAAQRDLSSRAEDEIRGRRALWRLACLTSTVGPLAYFRWGRRPGA